MNETMTDLDAVRLFVRVAESGSFTAAAKRLQIPKSTVSRRVADLESALGARLLHRTTRKLSLTDEGRIYLARAQGALEQLQEAESAISSLQDAPRGVLRLSAPVDFGLLVMDRLLLDFQHAYPDVKVELDLSGRRVDMVAEGFDLVLRASQRLDDASLVARKLVASDAVLFASPGYLAEHPAPRTPSELNEHQILAFRNPQSVQRLHLQKEGQTIEVELHGHITCNDFGFLQKLAVAGAGIAPLPLLQCARDVVEQRLVPVLPEYKTFEGAIYAVYPSSRHLSPKVRAFVDFVAERLSGLDAEAKGMISRACNRAFNELTR